MFVTYSHAKFHLPSSNGSTTHRNCSLKKNLPQPPLYYYASISSQLRLRIFHTNESQPSVAQLTTSRFRHVVTATMKFNTLSTAVSCEDKDDIKVRINRPEDRMGRQTDGTMISYVYFFPSFNQ